ncbi:MAG: hypothetical protein JJ863_22560 [Deltaproteobacteria bacterium]|nr:hypothetical protein [Deltaproteobacteria bacterium]
MTTNARIHPAGADYVVDPAGVAWREVATGVDEQLSNREGHIALAWHFDARPRGEVTVSIPFADHLLHRTIDEGLVLRREGRSSGILVSHATWIDADGIRARVPAAWADGEVTYALSGDLLAASSFPAVLDPTIGPEVSRPLGSGAGPFQDAADDQVAPRACANGAYALFVWSDERRPGEPLAVYGGRVSWSGSLNDDVGVYLGLADPSDAAVGPDCAKVSGGFTVVWTAGGTVRERFVPRAGDVTAPEVSWGSDVVGVRTASDGTRRAVLTWSRDGSGTTHQLALRRYDASGVPIDGSPVEIATGAVPSVEPTITATTAGYVVAWRDDSTGSPRVLSSAIEGTGAATPTSAALATEEPLTLTSASEGPNALVAWDTAGNGIRGRKLDDAGTPLGSVARLTRGPSDDAGRLTYGTDGYHLVYRTSGGGSYYTGVLAPAAAPGLASERVLNTTAVGGDVSVAADGDLAVVVYDVDDTSDPTLGRGIWSQRIDDNAFIGNWDTRAIHTSQAEASRFDADVDWGESYYAILHRTDLEHPSYGPQVVGQMVLADGTGTNGTWEASGGVTGLVDTRYRFAIASSGTEFFVAWTDYYASRYGFHGAIIDDPGTRTTRDFEIDENTIMDDLISNPSGIGYVALYGIGSRMYRRTVGVTGAVGSEYSIATGPSDSQHVRGAGDLITWFAPSTGLVYTHRWVTSAGAAETFRPPSTQVYRPAIAPGGGGTYLYVWQDGSTLGSVRILSQLLDANGAPVGAIADLGEGAFPSVAWTGSAYLVVFQSGNDIAAVRVDSTGRLLDATAALLTEDIDARCRRPSVDSDGRERALVAYQRMMDETGSTQIRARLVDLAVPGTDPQGSPCENGWSCASGFCADGFCCDDPCTGDCETCAAASGASSDGTCTAKEADSICRPALNECDAAERCTGSTGTCPADSFQPAGTPCGRGPLGPCDVADSCEGGSTLCVSTERMPSSTVCRESTGPCDLAELCNGSTVDCPPDTLAGPIVVCRAAAGECDVEERCDGASVECPADDFRLGGTVCRNTRGPCDQPELCTGSGPSCPSDQQRPSGFVCRPSRGVCDLPESCSGSSPSCPADAREPEGTVCRPSAGVCDVEETCGADVDCPEDRLRPVGEVCRVSTGACDIAEACDGLRPTCSADRTQADGVSCDDGRACNGIDSCLAGECVDAASIMCGGGFVCDERLGGCVPATDDGCGCRTAGGPTDGNGLPAGFLVLLGIITVRRRR